MNDDFSLPDDSVAAKNTDNTNDDSAEPSFKTPEQVAAQTETAPGGETPIKSKKGLFSKFKNSNLSKKQKIALVVLLIAVLVGLLGAAWIWKNKKSPTSVSTPAVKKEEPPKPTTEPSKLTGREVALEVNQRPVTAVMIENSPDARPQSGLKDAGVVFEAIAEGGVTRFVALYQDTQPDYIGPIRSARPYYIQWIMGFDAAFAHVGGSPDALAAIKSLGTKDLDQFANAGAYERVKNRYAPHNVYSSIAKFNELEKSKGWTTSNYTGFVHKAKDTPLAAPTHKIIDVKLSGFYYNPHWAYDTATNSYLRSQASKPHTDERSGAQLSSKVVIVMVMNKGVMADGYHTTYATTGSGKVFVFQDGAMHEGTWAKTDTKNQISFLDANGKPLAINPGQAWVTAVGSATDVTASP